MVSNDDHLCVARQSSKNRLEGLTSRRVNTKIVNDEYKIESRLFKRGEGRGEKNGRTKASGFHWNLTITSASDNGYVFLSERLAVRTDKPINPRSRVVQVMEVMQKRRLIERENRSVELKDRIRR